METLSLYTKISIRRSNKGGGEKAERGRGGGLDEGRAGGRGEPPVYCARDG